ncbi:hypothetical protein SB660_22175, partial [Bacillus sp. SIMBA_005]
MTEQREKTVALSLSGVTQKYGSVTAVNDVSLEVRDGEFFTRLAPSCSVNLTLLMLTARFQ